MTNATTQKAAIAANMAEFAMKHIRGNPWFGMKSERAELLRELNDCLQQAETDIIRSIPRGWRIVDTSTD